MSASLPFPSFILLQQLSTFPSFTQLTSLQDNFLFPSISSFIFLPNFSLTNLLFFLTYIQLLTFLLCKFPYIYHLQPLLKLPIPPSMQPSFFQLQPLPHHSTIHYLGSFPMPSLSHTPLLSCQPLLVSPAPTFAQHFWRNPILLSYFKNKFHILLYIGVPSISHFWSSMPQSLLLFS